MWLSLWSGLGEGSNAQQQALQKCKRGGDCCVVCELAPCGERHKLGSDEEDNLFSRDVFCCRVWVYVLGEVWVLALYTLVLPFQSPAAASMSPCSWLIFKI